MSKIELDPIASGFNLETINDNFQRIEDEFNQKVLYRDNPGGNPNHMLNNIDMNGKNLLNVGSITGGGGVPGQTADNITFTPGSGVSSTNVQDAIEEVAQLIVDSAAGVSTYNGRIGTVVGISSDVTGALGYIPAPTNNPILTGDVFVPTRISSDNSNAAASTAFVKANSVTSFNTRSGVVTLTGPDVVAALGYTPAMATGPNTVLNIAALKALASASQTAMTTRGYYTQGDGGGSTYYMDLTDTTSTDDGGSVIVASDGGRWKLAAAKVYSARQFGAKGNSSYSVAGNDDTVPLQKLITYIQKTGTTGYIPAGRYRHTTQLNIADNCNLIGDGWKDVRDMTPLVGPNTRDWTQSKPIGTILYADYFNGVAPAQIYVEGNSVSIKNMEFEVNQPAPSASSWTPNSVPLAISAFRNNYYEQGGNSLTLDNIMLRNHNNGIKMFGVVRGFLNNIYGQVFGTGIDITHNFDVLRINNVHLNWSFFSGLAATNAYMDANATALLLGRVDNPIVTNFFTFGGNIGIHLYTDTVVPDGGSTFRLQASNIGLDNMGIGVRLDDACSASFSNLYVFNRAATAGSRGIHGTAVLGGGYVPQRLNLVNCDFEGSNAEAIRLEVQGNCNASNVQITSYNNSGGSFPGIAAYSGMAVQIANLSNTTLSSTPLTQAFGTGTITIAGSGGSGGVSSFNTRTGSVVLNATDMNSALTTATTYLTNPGTLRSTGQANPPSGVGVEITYSTSLNSGFINAYDRSGSVYKDIVIRGTNITFANAGGNVGSWDTSGYLQILTLPSSTDVSTKAATTQWVNNWYGIQPKLTSFQGRATAAAVLTSGDITGVLGYTPANNANVVNTFNTRTGAVTLTSGDVTGALGYTPQTNLGYTPLPTSNPSSTGLHDNAGTIRATSQTNPGSGAGLELTYSTGLSSGFVNGFDRGSGLYTGLSLGGSTIGFKSGTGGTAAGFFDTNQSLLIGYGTTNGSTYKLQVNSQIFATSAVIATSDVRVKEDIEDVINATSKVLSLRPVTYKFKKHAVHNFPEGIQIGFIAQEVEEALSGSIYTESVVHTLDDGDENLKGLAEAKIVPLLVATIKELEARIRVLENK